VFCSLVQEKGGFYAITNSSDWKEIYTDLKIPKITPAASHHVKQAYNKYLVCFEEYVMSFQQNKNQKESITKSPSKKSTKTSTSAKSPRSTDDAETGGRRLSRRRKVSESHSTIDDNDTPLPVKETKRSRKNKLASESKRDSDADEVSSTASSDKSSSKAATPSSVSKTKPELKQITRTRSNSGTQVVYKVGDKLRVKYGRDSFKLYNAKVVDVKTDPNNEVQYLVHYTGWNSRHDEWIKQWKISSLFHETSLAKTPVRRPKTPTPSDEKNNEADSNLSSTQEMPPSSSENIASTPISTHIEKKKVSSLAKAFQDESKKISEKRKRMRRRSTSSSTPPPTPSSVPPPLPPSTKRASSVEKFSPEESEAKASPKQDCGSGDEKIPEKTSPSTSGVPDGLFPASRRTSGRRSKSPAYLRDAALYGLTKRKRNNSAVSEAQSNADTDQALVDSEDLSSESSSKSSTSSNSDANRSSPLTVWTAAAAETEQNRKTENGKTTEKSKKTERKRTRRKSADKKLSQISEESGSSLSKRSAAYDIFDDEVPNIELERSSGDSGRKSKTSKKRKTSSDKQESVIRGTDGNKETHNTTSNPIKFSEKAVSPAASTDSPTDSPPTPTSSPEAGGDKNEQQSESNVSF